MLSRNIYVTNFLTCKTFSGISYVSFYREHLNFFDDLSTRRYWLSLILHNPTTHYIKDLISKFYEILATVELAYISSKWNIRKRMGGEFQSSDGKLSHVTETPLQMCGTPFAGN